MNRLELKASARRARIRAKHERPITKLVRDPDLPLSNHQRLHIGNISVRTTNRQEIDERGKTTRTPPRRTR